MNNYKFTYDHLAVIGVSHWKAPVSVREQFSFTDAKRDAFFNKASSLGYTDVILLTTCNRSEVLVYSDNPDPICELFIQLCEGTSVLFAEYGFIKHGQEAAEHFFKVAVGLDSQITGDLQIIKQVKEACEYSHRRRMTGKILHRFIQCVFKAHKRSRRETGLATGAATIAYAAVQYARHYMQSLEDKRIVLIGTGKIGKATCKILMGYGVRNVTLVNRSKNRAKLLGEKFRLPVAGFSQIDKLIADADVIIVATGANHPVINADIVPKNLNGKLRIMLDMSVPRNIDPTLAEHPGIRIVNMDMLTDMTEKTNRRRQENIPLVEAIIRDEITDFHDWLDEQKIVPAIKAFDTKLEEIRQAELLRFHNQNGDSDLNKIELLTNRITKKFLAFSINYIKENQRESEGITRMNDPKFYLE